MRPSRQARRVAELAWRREAKKAGMSIPEYFPCPTCKGSARRTWGWLRWLPRWLWTLCRTCAGSGHDRVPAVKRLAEMTAAQVAKR